MVRALTIGVLALASTGLFADDLISPEGRNMLIGFEVTSRSVYERKYLHPICPACDKTASGVTLGIGYDIGYYRLATVRMDWSAHPQLDEFSPYTGLTGSRAAQAIPKLRHVTTPYLLAEQVFDATTVVQYYRVAARTFGAPFLSAPPEVRAALLSLVLNRGGSLGASQMHEDTLPPFRRNYRWEMRQIANRCLPAADYACVARMFREMKRLWPSVPGLVKRRETEAKMVERAL